jgi:aminoglycoside phosphotransferase (APT) family kinase protein
MGSDAVESVLAAWGGRRDVRLIRPFDHGVGGTSLVEIDGSLRVLKAWRLRSAAEEDHLDEALELAETMRGRGVPVPALIERGRAEGCGYLVWEFLDGEWSDQLGAEAVADLMSVIAVARGAAPMANTTWVAELETMLHQGDASFDTVPAALAASTTAEAVLTEARRRLAACETAALPTSDIVHGDFAPENLLLRDGRVVGVVDWERARVGDAGLDLVGAIFDIEIGEKAPVALRDAVWRTAREVLPGDALALYVGVYAVRYLSWSIGTDMEGDVLALAHRMLRLSDTRAVTPDGRPRHRLPVREVAGRPGHAVSRGRRDLRRT